MIILIAFAFLAGIITVLSPCILPILPIILSSTIGGQKTGKARPIGVVTGFILSFTFFTLFLSTLVRISGISADVLRLVSVVVIAGFGVSLLIPQFQLLVEKLFSKLARFMPKSQNRVGFSGGLVIGLSVGLLWTPCVGPILASVISLAITGIVTFDAFLITFAYALGTAIPMFLIILGGQNALRKVPWLQANTANIQKAFGVLMIITAIGIHNNVDRRFQTFVLNKFPQYGAGLTKFEDNETIKKQLEKINGKETKEEDMGKPTFNLLDLKGRVGPEIIPGGVWFNSDPLTLAQLKGKVVIIDFWTYTCINCQRTMPYLRAWHEKYKDKGLVIIGVHSPEFEFEKSERNVAQAIKDFKLPYPIVQDNDFATWRAYDNRYWPAKYILDKDGLIRYTHFGEGAYDETEKVIQELLKETGAKDVSRKINNSQDENYAKTPEVYLGGDRMEHLYPQGSTRRGKQDFTLVKNIPQNNFSLGGVWTIDGEYSVTGKNAALELNFVAKKVFVVLRPGINKTATVKVSVQGKTPDGTNAGNDVKNGIITVDSDRLYEIVDLKNGQGNHILRLEFQTPGIEVFAFTFG